MMLRDVLWIKLEIYESLKKNPSRDTMCIKYKDLNGVNY